jgi:hypothetical protein
MQSEKATEVEDEGLTATFSSDSDNVGASTRNEVAAAPFSQTFGSGKCVAPFSQMFGIGNNIDLSSDFHDAPCYDDDDEEVKAEDYAISTPSMIPSCEEFRKIAVHDERKVLDNVREESTESVGVAPFSRIFGSGNFMDGSSNFQDAPCYDDDEEHQDEADDYVLSHVENYGGFFVPSMVSQCDDDEEHEDEAADYVPSIPSRVSQEDLLKFKIHDQRSISRQRARERRALGSSGHTPESDWKKEGLTRADSPMTASASVSDSSDSGSVFSKIKKSISSSNLKRTLSSNQLKKSMSSSQLKRNLSNSKLYNLVNKDPQTP